MILKCDMECHNITENNAIFFHNNTVKSCIGLTATPPKDQIKVQLLSKILKVSTYKDKEDYGRLKLVPTYQITLDEAVEMGLVAPYNITVVTMPLDDKDKYIVSGKPGNLFMQTEFERYSYLTRSVNYSTNKFSIINRMRFIYTLKSKTEIAKKILENVIPKDIRTLIFCGSKEQANQVCEYKYYSKPSPPKRPKKNTSEAINKYEIKVAKYVIANNDWKKSNENNYNLFIEEKINRLACVDALNEGQNIPNVDCAFMIQVNSNDKDLWQRIGRIIRFRPGHIGKIIILTVKHTVDEDWMKKATKGLDNARIREIKLADLRTGKEKINFN